MNRTALVLCAIVACGSLAPAHTQRGRAAAPPPAVAARLDTVLDQIVNGIPNVAPGAPAATLLVQTKEWRYAKSAGFTRRGGATPVTPDMAFQVGSNTKMMTAAIVLQLHEEGRLQIDDLMRKYLPAEAARLPNGDRITLRHLLSHRSGVWDYVDGTRPKPGETQPKKDGLFWQAIADQKQFLRSYTPKELVDFAVAHGTPEFGPGSSDDKGAPNFAYSNTGYILLGMVIEHVTRQKVENVFKTRVFDRLGMTKSRFETGVPREGATPHGYLEDRDATAFNLSLAWTAGAVLSTPDDMASFITGLLTGRLFKNRETLALMQSDPARNTPAGGDYALGLQDKANGGGLWGHGGETLAFESDVAYDVPSGTAIVAWGNTSTNLAALAARLVRTAR